MGLDDLVRGGVALARNLTLDLQPEVEYRAWVGQSGDGDPVYDPPIGSDATLLKALVVRKQQLVKMSDGREAMSQTYLAILEPMSANGATGRREPLDERDLFVLPDGTSGPILNITGLVDAQVGTPFFHEVYLG